MVSLESKQSWDMGVRVCYPDLPLLASFCPPAIMPCADSETEPAAFEADSVAELRVFLRDDQSKPS